MKNFKILILIILSVLLFSCKKNGTSPCRITKVVVNNNTVQPSLFTYDDQGRPTQIIDGNVKTKFTYTGTTGKIEYFDIAADTMMKYSTTDLTFDAGGRLITFDEHYYYYFPTILRYLYKFEYNADGYLLKNVQTLTGGVYNDYYCDSLIYNSDGNVITMYSKLNDGTINSTAAFTYSTDVNDQWNYFLSLGSSGEPFSILSYYYSISPLLGKPCKNLPTNISFTGSITDNYDLTYTLNMAGRVTEYSQVRNYNGSITTKNFKLTYSCD